jgi:hypothetical protein
MADLTTKARNALKATDFALPGRRYPIHDLAHARNALARVEQSGTPAEIATVSKKVARKFPTLKEGIAERHPNLVKRAKKGLGKAKK